METRKLDCTGCSNFCPLTVTIENNNVVSVEGNCCHRGLISARKQVENKKNFFQKTIDLPPGGRYTVNP